MTTKNKTAKKSMPLIVAVDKADLVTASAAVSYYEANSSTDKRKSELLTNLKKVRTMEGLLHKLNIALSAIIISARNNKQNQKDARLLFVDCFAQWKKAGKLPVLKKDSAVIAKCTESKGFHSAPAPKSENRQPKAKGDKEPTVQQVVGKVVDNNEPIVDRFERLALELITLASNPDVTLIMVAKVQEAMEKIGSDKIETASKSAAKKLG